MKTKKQTKEPEYIQVKVEPIRLARMHLGITGASPLIMHAWSQKALFGLRQSAAERRKNPKEKRDPQAEADGATYRTVDGGYGIPGLAFKAALVDAAHKDIGLTKVMVRGSIYLELPTNGIVPLETEGDPVIREDVVRVGQGKTDLRYRPEFFPWRAQFSIVFNVEAMQPQDIVNLANRAGFNPGLGEWRPGRGGDYGRFVIDETVDMGVEELEGAFYAKAS